MSLSDLQRERYARQIMLPGFGEAGQERLLAARVLIVGVGGLGSPVALYLAAAGVGTIGLADADTVALSNLQRQVIHSTPDLGRPKVESAAAKMRAINPDVRVVAHGERLVPGNALDIVRQYEFVIDATDNFAAKFLIADACHFAARPYSHAGIFEYRGQTMTVRPGVSACYRCVFGAPPAEGAMPPAAQVGVPGVLPGLIGVIQATEALKFLLGAGELLENALLVYEALEMRFRKVPVARNRLCPLCGEAPSIGRPGG